MGVADTDGDVLHYYHISPIGSIVAWNKSMTGVPALGEGWAECDGSVIDDDESPMDGETLPDLNGDSETTSKFLRGAETSGGEGATAAHTHTMASGGSTRGQSSDWSGTTNSTSHIPPYFEVVFIMRIK